MNRKFKNHLPYDWTATEDHLPEEGQEVTVRTNHGQIKQVVKDKSYVGGWKQVNCQGWECVSSSADTITHWRPEIFDRPSKTGPDDAPWMVESNEFINTVMGYKNDHE